MKTLRSWIKNYLVKTMNSEPDQVLERFAFRFLENQGAVLERDEGGFEALLPERLAGFLGTPEHIRISRESGSELDGVYSINYGSPLLEKMSDASCDQVPLLACRLEFGYVKSQGFDQLIKEQFNFSKWLGKVETWAKIKTDYLFLTCRYTAQSDEQKEGLVNLAFNLETGAYVPHMVHMLTSVTRDLETQKKSPTWKDEHIEKITEWVRRELKETMSDEIGPFQESMNRRFRRDVANLAEYYEALKKEMEKSLERPSLSDELIKQRREKIALLPDELSRKRDDLFKKYSIKVKVEPCAAMLINTLAVKILYKISIGRDYKSLSLIYNPVTKSMDPLVCQGCGRSITSVYFCDNLHSLCSTCSDRCSVC